MFDFKEEVRKKLQERGYLIKEFITNKTNVQLHSFCLDSLEDIHSNNFHKPTFYYEDLVDELVDIIIKRNTLHSGSELKKFNINKETLSTFENIEKNLYCAFINKEKNEELLKNVPHIVMLDLALVFKVKVSVDDLSACFIVNNSVLKSWKKGVDDLLESVWNNKDLLVGEDSLVSLVDKCKDLCSAMEKDLPFPMPSDDYIYILTNKYQCDGASMMFTHKEYVRDFANRKESDVLILPSSRHEVLLIPTSQVDDYEYVKNMVANINRTELAKQDFLSDNVYLYNRNDDEIHIL